MQFALKDVRTYQQFAEGDEWAASLKQRLHRHDLEVLKELTSLLKEMENVGSATSAEEVFSLLGIAISDEERLAL